MPQLGPVQRARVAFDGTNFLVVWHDLRTLGSGVRAALVSQQGVILGGADFFISATTDSSGINPQAVFTGDDYLIAWQDAPLSGNGQQIFFTRVSTSGTPGSIVSVPPLAGHDSCTTARTAQFPAPPMHATGQAVIVYQ